MSSPFGAPSPENEQITAILPKEQEGYFKDTEAKHFNPETGAGSLFTEVKTLNDLLKLAIQQRGSLDGDDKEKFAEMGVDPKALMGFCRYLKVDTAGEVGIKAAKDLPLDTKVKVVRMKQGAPCSFIITSDEFAPTDFGTIIIGPNEKAENAKPEDPEPSTKEMIWTVHPGLPVRPVTADFWPEGSEITVKDLKEKLGEDIFVNIKRAEKSN